MLLNRLSLESETRLPRGLDTHTHARANICPRTEPARGDQVSLLPRKTPTLCASPPALETCEELKFMRTLTFETSTTFGLHRSRC